MIARPYTRSVRVTSRPAMAAVASCRIFASIAAAPEYAGRQTIARCRCNEPLTRCARADGVRPSVCRGIRRLPPHLRCQGDRHC